MNPGTAVRDPAACYPSMVIKLQTKKAVILLACAVGLVAFSAAAQPVKIGYIDMPRIERESKRVNEGVERLKREFAPREQAFNELNGKFMAFQSEVNKLPANTPEAVREKKRRELSDMAQRFEQTGRRLVEDVEHRKSEERQKFFRDVSAIVKKIAEAQKLDLVLQEAVYAGRAVDITDQVIKALDQ